MAKVKWLKSTVMNMNKGAFSRKAKKAGMSTRAYAAKVGKKGSGASTKTKRQARFAKLLMSFRKSH